MFKPYAQIADQIIEKIVKGDLPVGTRLPSQRLFAYEHGIANSTASRVYEELGRRGFVIGEVGRGTYVTNRFTPIDASLQEPSTAELDLEIVFRLGSSAKEKISASTSRFFKKGIDTLDIAPPSVKADQNTSKILLDIMMAEDQYLQEGSLLLAGSGKEAIAASLSALAPRGGRIGVEALTYPFVIATARLLGIDLVSLPMDQEGIIPDALDHEAAKGLDGIYLQPTLQNPLVLTMTNARRKEIANLLQKNDLIAIEDRVYDFLKPTKPIAFYAPDHVIQINSLSKCFMPGLTIGLILAPSQLEENISISLKAGGWMAPKLSVALAKHWIEESVVYSVANEKREEAKQMYKIAKKELAGLNFQGDPFALHGWLELPSYWRAESFVTECAKLGIAIASGSVFAVSSGVSPKGVRIAFSAPNLQTWKFAMRELSKLIKKSPN
ncbi:PLP-dependent aminotransferase family protein [Pseudemcibacter aquimaris]|uniref:aminotransferase-like domain-containing protein n=1 Tax=Pseudemcibacter aquimaris TaxID=2857064 RepID=UPI0020121021|nr:PLP-dependent aminotransferase family protein [Pseudemcibacter aquimaris]MCC3861918.1 PLP-dependent aminotransferase family protein [Pseudemcibacter aquimaris]WDU58670.1 PLP-dependent aminotransferase family protein [Pseudemcibacter aquimaris]